MMMQDKHKIPIIILICDDDEDDRTLTKQALEDAHISNDLRFVDDGEQLLDYLPARRIPGETAPRRALIDPSRPQHAEDDGREACSASRESTLVDIPIVAHHVGVGHGHHQAISSE